LTDHSRHEDQMLSGFYIDFPAAEFAETKDLDDDTLLDIATEILRYNDRAR
jgi:hypothetical protein